MLRAGTKRDLDALIGIITNSGASRTTVCWTEHQYSVSVVEGLIEDDARFVFIASLDEGDDWRDENVWIKANPGLGTILPMEYIRQQVREGINKPSKQNTVKRLHACIWTEQVDRWLDMIQWDACGLMPIIPESLAGETCFIGLDLASRHDFTAAVFYFPKGQVAVPFFWVPEDMTQRTEQERQIIRTWAQAGLVKLTEGNITDYDVVREDILREAEKYQVEELAYDTWNATQLATQLQQEGLDVVPMQQGGAAMSEAAKALAAMVAEGTLTHGNHPVLRWMAANVAVREDLQGNIRLDRDKSGDKIDGIAALTMAIARASVYEDTGDWVIR
jgi:phage terminase large subunit-like protein